MMFRLLLLLCLGHCLPAVLGVDLNKRKESETCVGCNVTLLCDGSTDIANQSVQWLFHGKHVGYITNGRWDGRNNFKNRTQLVCIQTNNFSLVIYNVRKDDEGEYTCDVNNKEKRIVLFVGQGKKEDAETLTGGDHVCRPDPPESVTKDIPDPDKNRTESETKDKKDSDEKGPSPGVIVVIVLVVLVVVAVGAAVLIKLWQKQQTDENPTDCIQFFHACGKEGKKKRGKNLPDPGPSEDALI